MRNLLGRYVNRYEKKHRDFRHYAMIVAVLALVVFVGVNWRLHDKGISMTSDYQCGLKEHKHTADCYKKVLICGKEETDGSEGHTHTDACYKEEKKLTCDKEEHTHDADCYDEEGNLICDKEEHTHSQDCYTTEKKLICGKEESKPVKAHHHTDDCYKKELVCGLKEHTHTASCYSDESADIENKSDWEATIPTLSGNWAEDVVSIAQSQLGYEESTANFKLADDGETRKGYTRYGAWYGNKYGDWSAMFASFCLNYAEIPSKTVPVNSGSIAWITKLKQQKLYKAAANYNPTAGDLVFLDTDSDGRADHVGIITKTKTASFTAVVGDSNDAVEENTYKRSSDAIIGYCALPENPKQKTDAESTTAAKASEEKTTEESAGESTKTKSSTKTENKTETAETGSSIEQKLSDGSGSSLMKSAKKKVSSKSAKRAAATQNAAEGMRTASYADFSSYVTSMEGTGTKYDKNTGNYETNLKTNFTISKEQIKSDNYSYELKYPEGIIVPDELLNNEYRLLDEQQQQAGTYSFVKNTDGTYSVRVVFDQSYVNNAGDTINGNIWFNGKLSSTKVDEQGNIVIAGQDKVNLNIPSRDITYPDDETDKYNIDVSKEGSVIEGSKLKYTVKINSTKGTPDKIDFTDIINVKNMSLGTPEVSVKKQPVKWYSQHWQAVDSSKEESVTVNPTYDANTGKLTMELPQLTAKKQNDHIECFQYVVTYTYDITGMDVASTKAGNTVNVKSHDQKTDTTVKDTASTNIDVNNPYTISKSGKIADGKKIEWKITVNDKKANIAGATVSDTMFKDIPSDADIKVSPATGYRITKGTDGKIENIQFKGVEDGKNNQTYTIIYHTTYKQTDAEQNIINNATFKPSNGKELHDKDTVKIPGCSIEKKLDGVTGPNAGKATLKWTVSMDVPDTGLASGTVIQDDMTANKEGNAGKPQYMTAEQIKSWKGMMQWDNNTTLNILDNANVVFYDKEGKEYSYSDIQSNANGVTSSPQFTKFKITLKKNVALPTGATKLTYTYETTADLSSSSKGKNYYYNTVDKDGKKADATYTYDNNHSISKKGEKADNNRIQWTITVNKEKANIAGAVLSDPNFANGTDLQISPNNGYEYEYNEQGKIKDIKFKEVSDGQNTQKYKITYYTSYEPSWSSQTISNTATFKPGTGEDITGTGKVTVPGGRVSKEVDKVTEKTDGTASVKWNITVNVPNGTIPCNNKGQQVYIKDNMDSTDNTLKDSHYMTVEQIKSWNGKMQWDNGTSFDISANGQATVKFQAIGDDEYYYTLEAIRNGSVSSDIKFVKMKIKLLKDLVAPEGSTVLTYSYETTADLSNAVPGENKYANEVTVDRKVFPATYSYDNKHTVSKTAEKLDNNEIKWTITVNANKMNIAGGVLKDDMFKAITDLTKFTISPDDKQSYDIIKETTNGKETIKEIQFKSVKDKDGKDTHKNTNTYTITYYTPYEKKWDKQDITNKASFKPVTGKEIETSKTVTIPGCSFEKTQGTVDKSEDNKTATINWTVGIDIPDAGFPAGTVIKDDMTKNTSNNPGSLQYMTAAQIKAWGGQVKWDNNSSFNIFDSSWSEKVTFYDINNKEYTYEDIQNVTNGVTGTTKFTKFEIKLKQNLTKPSNATKITYSYATTVDLFNVPMGENKYYNSAWVGDKGVDATYRYDKGKVVKKDGNGNTGTTDTSSENELTWKIEVTTGSDEYNTIKVTDILPEGLKLKGISIIDNDGRKVDSLTADSSGNIKGQNDTYKVTGTYAEKSVDSKRDKINLNLSYVDTSKKIPPNTTYTVTVVCETKDSSQYKNNETYTFSNDANVTFDNKEIGSSSQTQNWTKKKNTVEHKVVDKTGTWDGNSHQADYSIVLNPDGKDVVEGVDVLTLTDVLDSVDHPYHATSKDNSSLDYSKITFTVELIPTTVKLYYAVANSDGSYGKGSNPQQVQGYKWTYTKGPKQHNNGITSHTLTLTNVPDSTPLVLEYRYSVKRDAPANVAEAQVKFNNTATLSGEGNNSSSSDKTEMWKESATGGDVSTEKAYTIYKVEEGNYGKLLQGAIFKLQKYDATAEGNYSDVNPEKTFTTDKDGKIQIKWDASLYQSNTLYRLIEKTPPEGYKLSSNTNTDIYFYFSKADGTANNLPDAIPSKAVDLTKKAATIYVENESKNTSISIKKNWKDSEGTTISAPVDEIKVDLYQEVYTQRQENTNSENSVKAQFKYGQWNTSYNNDLSCEKGDKLILKLKDIHGKLPTVNVEKDGKSTVLAPVSQKKSTTATTYTYNYKVDGAVTITLLYNDNGNDGDRFEYNVMQKQDSKRYATYTISRNQDHWQKEINNLPLTGEENGKTVYYAYYIKEQNESAYKKVEYSNNDGITTGIITLSNTISEAYTLPETGGGGILPFIAGGASLMGFALLCGYSIRRRRGRRVE